MFQPSDISHICITGLCRCERTEIAEVKTDEKYKKNKN